MHQTSLQCPGHRFPTTSGLGLLYNAGIERQNGQGQTLLISFGGGGGGCRGICDDVTIARAYQNKGCLLGDYALHPTREETSCGALWSVLNSIKPTHLVIISDILLD